MAIQAQWHDVLFEQSATCVRTIQSINFGDGLEFERNDDTEGQSATQIVRRKLQTVSITYEALSKLNVWPREEYRGWYDRMSAGIHAPLYINGESLWGHEFVLKDIKLTSDVINANGFIIFGEVTLSFEEYAEEASGLKVDKGFEIGLTPGIQTYEAGEFDAALKARASADDRARMAAIGATI